MKEFKSEFTNWKEAITTSLSGRHIGHIHSLLKPDGTQYPDEVQEFSDTMLSLHHTIISTSIALLNPSPLYRSLVTIVILTPEDPGQSKIHRLRIINTYEADYNLVLKYC